MRKRYHRITVPRLRTLEKKWRATLARFAGPVPGGLGIAHMLAESNGNEDPTLRNAQLRPVGLMQIPYREGRRFKYAQKDLKDPLNNIYVWCLLANEHAKWLHNNFTDWAYPDVDFWVGVRAVFVLGRTNFVNLYDAIEGDDYSRMTGIANWVQTQMNPIQRFDGLSRADLRRIVDHLEEVRLAIKTLDGPQWVSKRFSGSPAVAPGTELMRHQTVAALNG